MISLDIELAISIALEAHKGQKDKGGNPYILHPLAVMNRLETIEEKIVAVLHDVVEDFTDVTLSQLRGYGFTEEIVEAVSLLTKSEEDSYEEFIEKTLENRISRSVKIADIKENMKIERIKQPTENDYKRLEKYRSALELLENK